MRFTLLMVCMIVKPFYTLKYKFNKIKELFKIFLSSFLIMRMYYSNNTYLISLQGGGGLRLQNAPSPTKRQIPLASWFIFFRSNGIRLFDSPPDTEGLPRPAWAGSSSRQNM
jgi:hypothetical protein